MLLRFKIWPRCVVLNSVQFHRHFGIEICFEMLLNFDMMYVKTKNMFMLVFFLHTAWNFVLGNIVSKYIPDEESSNRFFASASPA